MDCQDFDDYLIETFAYDDLNRLTTVSVCPLARKTCFSYDLLGDMTSKADVGTYSFPAAGQAHPHGVASIAMAAGGTTNLAYDYDGQLTSETGPITRTIGWTLFNKVASTAYAGLSTQFNYDADENVVDFVRLGCDGRHPAGRCGGDQRGAAKLAHLRQGGWAEDGGVYRPRPAR